MTVAYRLHCLRESSLGKLHTDSRGTPHRVRLRSLRDVDDELTARWQQLADRAVEPNPFAGPDVALPAASNLAGGDRALLLTAERGTELTFALPVTRKPAFRPLPPAVLQFWDHPYAFLGTPLVHPDHGVDAWRALRTAMREQRLSAWLLLKAMSTDGPVARGLDEAAGRGPHSAARAQPLLSRGRPVAYRRAEPTYLAGHSRRSLRRAVGGRRRRLAELLGGEVATVERVHGERCQGAVEEFLSLESSGWKGRAGTALSSESGSAAFFREMCRRHADRRALQLLSLQGPTGVAAMTCNLLAGDTAFCFKTGYDEDLARCSPGLQIQVDNLSWFHNSVRFSLIDSCADTDSHLARRVFPDTREQAAVLVPGAGLPHGLLARAAPWLAGGLRRVRSARDSSATPTPSSM